MDIASIDSTKKTILVLVGIFVGSAPWKSWGILCCSYIVYLVCKFMKDGTKFKKINLGSLVELTTILGEAFLVIFGFIFINHEEDASFWDVHWTFGVIYWVFIIPINSVAGTLGSLKACQFCVLEVKRRCRGGGGSIDKNLVVGLTSQDDNPLTGVINPLESQVVLTTPLSEDYLPPTLDEFEFCTNCGAKMPVDADVCGKCGRSESQSRKDVLAALLAAENLEQYSDVLEQQGCVKP
jgi:hypothetical protein